MKIPRKLKEGSAKATRTLVAGVLAVGLMPVPAFAATDLSAVGTQDLTTQADPVAKNSTGYITAAAYAAAEPAPEILGLNNFNFRTGTNGAAQNKEVLDIAKMFGNAEINEAVNPFVYNAANGLTPGVQYDGRGGGPTAALAAVNDKDWGESATKVWAEKPNIVLGTGSDQYPKADASDTKGGSYEDQFTYYTTKGSEYTGVTEENYSPIGVTYNRVDLPGMVGTMYSLADAVERVQKAENTKGLKTRYEDIETNGVKATAKNIAMDYERYVVGAKGAVKWAIDQGKVKQKTIACVNDYKADGNVYRIITSGFAEGTAATNRYLETVAGVANDYYYSAENKDSYTAKQQGKDVTTQCAWVTADDLRNKVDTVIVGSNAGSDSDVIKQLAKDGLQAKSFYCTDWGGGSVFGTTVNSVENAQNVGRILPCVYPEVLDQSDMIAYYYDMFYHIQDSAIASTIDTNMDGVRNWDNTDSAAFTQWTKEDVSGYNQAKVETLLTQGITYLKGAGKPADNDPNKAYLTPTTNLAEDNASPDTINVKKTQTITASDFTKTEGDAAFSIGAKTNGNGALSYESNDTSVATVDSTGKVTIKGVGATTITITAAGTDTYAQGIKIITVTVKAKEKAAAAETKTETKTDTKTDTTTTETATEVPNTAATGEGLSSGATAETGSGATAATVKATADDEVAYVAPASKSTKTVKVPDTVEVNGKTYKVTSISASAFKGSKATKITVGNNVTTIGKGAFQNAKKLKTLTLGKAVKKIGKNAFKGTKKLTKVTLKSSKVTKSSFKNMIKGSKIKTVKTKSVTKKAKKNYKKWAKSLGITVK